MDQAGWNFGLLGDALHRSVREPVLDDGSSEAVDDLPAARLGKAGPSHRVD
jgi:hypothetical protein